MYSKHMQSLLTSELVSRAKERRANLLKPQSASIDAVPLLKTLLSEAKDHYSERSRLFDQLDQKAQITAAISGAFLAALFAFLRKDNLDLCGRV